MLLLIDMKKYIWDFKVGIVKKMIYGKSIHFPSFFIIVIATRRNLCLWLDFLYRQIITTNIDCQVGNQIDVCKEKIFIQLNEN